MSSINSKTPFDIGLGLEETHVLVTGGCGLIGSGVVHAFLAAGAFVTVIDFNGECPFDLSEPNLLCCTADITNAEQLDHAFQQGENKFGPVETCVALASLDLSVLPQSESLADMDPAIWQRVFDVNVSNLICSTVFLTRKLLLVVVQLKYRLCLHIKTPSSPHAACFSEFYANLLSTDQWHFHDLPALATIHPKSSFRPRLITNAPQCMPYHYGIGIRTVRGPDYGCLCRWQIRSAIRLDVQSGARCTEVVCRSESERYCSWCSRHSKIQRRDGAIWKRVVLARMRSNVSSYLFITSGPCVLTESACQWPSQYRRRMWHERFCSSPVRNTAAVCTGS